MKALVPGLTVTMLFAGCAEKGHDEIRQWMEESSRDLKGGVPSLPELKPLPVVSYDAADEIDPFNAMRIESERKEETGGANKPDFNRPREPLENFPLETIRFVGIVDKTQSKARHAIVQVDGVVYSVGKGNYMGQDFGRIVDITGSEIVLREIVQDPSGQTSDWVERRVTLQLQEGAQGGESKK